MDIKLNQSDLEEFRLVEELEREIDNNTDDEYTIRVLEEMRVQQPMFYIGLLSFSLELTKEEFEELMKNFFLIWEYFKLKPNVLTNKFTDDYFFKIQNRNFEVQIYIEDASTRNEKLDIFTQDLQGIRSLSLFLTVLNRLNVRPALEQMSMFKKCLVMVDLKSFIECFDSF